MALAIFIFTYIFIAGARVPRLPLDRPGGALVGAVLMVVARVVTPDEVFRRAIDFDTLLLLLGMMLIAGYLTDAGFFRVAGARALHIAKTPRGLLGAVTWVSAVMSAFLVNDTICLMLTPLVVATVTSARLPPLPFLLAVCMGANAGSVATCTGNPQNMIIQGASGLSYASFAAFMALPAIASTAIVHLALRTRFKSELSLVPFDVQPEPPPTDRALLRLTTVVLVLVVAAFFAGLPMGWTSLAGAAVVMTLGRGSPRASLEKVDWVLLLFFSSLFVVVFGVNKEGHAEAMRQFFATAWQGSVLVEMTGFAALSLVASNLLSNVPFVMLARDWVGAMQNVELGWHVLALASTLAGNLTLVGSVANLIVFEMARERVQTSFMDYFRSGLVVTMFSLVVGLAILFLEHLVVGTLARS